MYILETGSGKSLKIVGIAADSDEAARAIRLAHDNGVTVKAREVEETPEIFRERDYNQEVMNAVQTLKEARQTIRNLMGTGKVNLSEIDATSVCYTLMDTNDDIVIQIATPHKLYINVGDYGYGRSIEWNTSNGETNGQWVSSSQSC